jgi:hypothetical protein
MSSTRVAGVGVVDRIGQQHFVALAEHGGERAGQTEGGAGGGEDLGARVVRDTVVARHLGRDGLAEPHLAAVVGIAGAAGRHRGDHRLGNVVGRPEIRLAAHQRDHRGAGSLHAPHVGQDGVDGGGFEERHAGRQRVIDRRHRAASACTTLSEPA